MSTTTIYYVLSSHRKLKVFWRNFKTMDDIDTPDYS